MSDLEKYGYSDWKFRLETISTYSDAQIRAAGQSFLANAISCLEDTNADRRAQALTDANCARSIFALIK